MAIPLAPAAAWERDAAPISRDASGVPVPAGLQTPPFPVLSGVVGPDVAAGGSGESGKSSTVVDPAAGLSVQDALGRDFVSPQAPTWDQATEKSTALIGSRTRSTSHEGAGAPWLVVLVVGAVGGTLAGLAAAFARGRSQMERKPVSILRCLPDDTRAH